MTVFQYGAEAYRLLLTLVDLIVERLIGPLWYLSLALVLLSAAGSIWLISFWCRRRLQPIS